MVSTPTAVGLTVLVSLLIYLLFSRIGCPSLRNIPGPKSSSFIFGNLLEIHQRPVGEADFKWKELYGNFVRFRGVLGGEQLMITDPKALKKILNTAAYTYPMPSTFRVIYKTWNGYGIFSAEGDDHRRHRGVMIPGFNQEANNFFPVFRECAESLSLKWLEVLQNGDGKTVVDVTSWISRVALDVIGQAFDIKFGTLQEDSHYLAKKYRNFFSEIFGLPSAVEIFILVALAHIPMNILDWITDLSGHSRLERARDLKKTISDVTKKLVEERKVDTLLGSIGHRDLLSFLVKANMDANAKNKLSDEELFAQISSILMAGHESTANSFSWILFELARNPKMQSRLRDEIRRMEVTIQERVNPQIQVSDLNSMTYLNAFIKEGLRFHPIVPHIRRIASQNDVLPLSEPILTASGKSIHEVLVPKGTSILISVAAFNRDVTFWGKDAHVFNPDRWLDGTFDEKRSFGIGIFANMLTFLSGTRSCLGWRFANIELQTLLFELVGKFEFGMTDKSHRIIRQPMLVMAPVVEGELERGVQLPLTLSLAPRD